MVLGSGRHTEFMLCPCRIFSHGVGTRIFAREPVVLID